MQEFLLITMDNITKVLKFNGYRVVHGGSPYTLDFKNNNRHVKFGRIQRNDILEFSIGASFLLKTYNKDEFLEIAVKKLDLKPLPKELCLFEWFYKLTSIFRLQDNGHCFVVTDKRGFHIGIVLKSIQRSQQEELILKIIEVYKDIK